MLVAPNTEESWHGSHSECSSSSVCVQSLQDSQGRAAFTERYSANRDALSSFEESLHALRFDGREEAILTEVPALLATQGTYSRNAQRQSRSTDVAQGTFRRLPLKSTRGQVAAVSSFNSGSTVVAGVASVLRSLPDNRRAQDRQSPALDWDEEDYTSEASCASTRAPSQGRDTLEPLCEMPNEWQESDFSQQDAKAPTDKPTGCPRSFRSRQFGEIINAR